jgi:hypothetical protein
LETFADDLGALSLFCLTEELFTSLLFVASEDLREELVSRVALELPENLEEAFFSTRREISIAFSLELFSTFLPAATVVDLRVYLVPPFTEDPEAALLLTFVAEDLSTPERLLSIDPLWADSELFDLRPLTEAFSRVLALCPELVLV